MKKTPNESAKIASTASDCAEFGPNPMVTLDSRYINFKLLADRLLAAILLATSLPIIGLLVVLIRLTSRGPGIYSQLRVGRAGHVFMMYKLRSMRCDAEARTGPVWSSSGRDPRITWIGYWLRLLHLDELPQLLNVLKGEMALVGPRPERPEFVQVLKEQVPGYLDRLQVRPGITGLAQINLPPDTDFNSVRRKLILDVEYIHTASASLDARILASTFLRMFGLRGGRAVRWLGLYRRVELPQLGVGSLPLSCPIHVVGADAMEAASDIEADGTEYGDPAVMALRQL